MCRFRRQRQGLRRDIGGDEASGEVCVDAVVEGVWGGWLDLGALEG